MRNEISDLLQVEFFAALGGAEQLASGNGTRYRSGHFSRLTVYHENIATGNSAEIAFHPQSLSESTGISEPEVRRALGRLRARTGCEVNFNLQQRWPRVGVRTG